MKLYPLSLYYEDDNLNRHLRALSLWSTRELAEKEQQRIGDSCFIYPHYDIQEYEVDKIFKKEGDINETI